MKSQKLSINNSPLSITYGSRTIDFHVEFSERKTLGITVTPELKVLVKAPVDSSINKIKEKLLKKAAWIIKQQSFFLSFQPKTPARKYLAGETHLYLGRQYRLRIENDKLRIDNGGVKLKGGFLTVYTDDITRVKELVESWYLQKSKVKLHEISKPLFDNFASKYKLSISNYPLKICQLVGEVVHQKER